MRYSNNSKALAAACALAWTLAAEPAPAMDCSNAVFVGGYAMQSENSIVGGPSGAWAAGTLYADGNGLITRWHKLNVFVHPQTGEKVSIPENVIESAGGAVSYEVSPDCRIAIRYVSARRPAGDQDVLLEGGLALGGQEVLAVQVLPKASTGGYIFKSTDPPARGMLNAIKALLNRLAVRNGIVPSDLDVPSRERGR